MRQTRTLAIAACSHITDIRRLISYSSYAEGVPYSAGQRLWRVTPSESYSYVALWKFASLSITVVLGPGLSRR
jgi:hypothetical protein